MTSMPYWIETELGRWTEPAVRAYACRSMSWTNVPRRAWIATIDRKVVATIKAAHKLWIVRIPGFEWSRSAHPSKVVPTIKYSAALTFLTSQAAKEAVEAAFASLPALMQAIDNSAVVVSADPNPLSASQGVP